MRRRSILFAPAFAVGLGHSPYAAAQDYPQRPIKIVVPYAAGSGGDTLARIIAPRLSTNLQTGVIVENREGAAGAIGTAFVAKSPPDGYTLLLTNPSMTVAAHTNKVKPYDPLNDFVPITKVATLPIVMVSSVNAPYKTFKELVAYARKNPGAVSYATSGKGSPSHLAVEVIRQFVQINILDVPYRSGAQALTETISGQVGFYYFSIAAAIPQIKAGKVHGLAIGAPRRSPQLPDVPTMTEELGVNIDIVSWNGFMAPAGTPKEIIAKLNSAFVRAMDAPEVRESIIKSGFDITVSGPEEFATLFREENARYGKLVADLGLRE